MIGLVLAQAAQMQKNAYDATGDGIVRREGYLSWFSDSASTAAGETDLLFMVILWVCIISFVGLMVAMTYFVIKYRRRPGVPPQRSASHNTPLELAWSIIPLLILAVIFVMGFEGYASKLIAPTDAEVINITGRQWGWDVQYDNGGAPRNYYTEDLDGDGELEERLLGTNPVFIVPIPTGKPVRVLMTSRDVIHSLFIPDFRQKIDVFPNRYTAMTFQAEELKDGDNPYHIVYCAEYCGNDHSDMMLVFQRMPYEEYRVAKEELSQVDQSLPPAERGALYYRTKGCITCHSTDGTANTGPSWKSLLFGEQRRFADGSTATIDEQYIRESVYDPGRKYVEGYDGVQMPVYQGQVSPDELADLIAFMKSLNPSAQPAPAAEDAAEPQPAGDAADSTTDQTTDTPTHEPQPAH